MNLTSENFKKGFLMDEELLGGITEDLDRPNGFLGFILRHTTGESLGHQSFTTLEAALAALNAVKRDWKFEKSSSCGSGACGTESGCGPGGSCGVQSGEACPAGKC